MALNDTINFNSTVDYFKLYNAENSTLSSAVAGDSSFANITATTHPRTTSLYPSTSTPSTLSASTSPSPTSAIPLVAATTLTITSTIINNYTSQNYSNYSNTNYSHNSNITSFNQSALYQFKNLSINASSDDNNSSINDSAKISYESGSNFMLLLEDFGEYFYNYNGSDFNSTINIYQANCSLTNSTCGDVTARKYPTLENSAITA